MFAEENRRNRRVIARLVRGESLREAIEQLARDHAVTTAWVSAHGVIARATLEARVPMGRGEASPRELEGPFELVSMTGDVASKEGRMHLDASVVLARHADHGMVTLGGHLLDAEAEGLTVMLDCLDDLGLRRETERPSGLDGWRSNAAEKRIGSAEPRREAPRTVASVIEDRGRPVTTEAPKTVPSAWAAVAAASSTVAQAGGRGAPAPTLPVVAPVLDPIADDRGGKGANEPVPVAGDWVDHRQFGLCRVDRATPEGELLIKLESGRRKEIRLDFLEVLPPRIDGNRKIFPLRPRKREG